MQESLSADEARFARDAAVAIAEVFFQRCGHLPRSQMALALLEIITEITTTGPDLEPWLVEEFATAICSEIWRLKDLADSGKTTV